VATSGWLPPSQILQGKVDMLFDSTKFIELKFKFTRVGQLCRIGGKLWLNSGDWLWDIRVLRIAVC
jgi:hypothetical protein